MITLKSDCIFFPGNKPCKPHKETGVTCENCNLYKPVGQKILIIKLDALGDVLRTTSILHALKEKEYRLGIVTNKPFDFVGPIMEALGLHGLFDFWLGGDSLEKKKPDPLPLLHACKHMNVSIDQCVMVGDSKNDLLAANTCGMQSIGVTYGYNYGEDIGIYNPTFIIDDFSELNELL